MAHLAWFAHAEQSTPDGGGGGVNGDAVARRREAEMDATQIAPRETTLSGRGMTLITTQGGQPVTAKTVEAWWESTKVSCDNTDHTSVRIAG